MTKRNVIMQDLTLGLARSSMTLGLPVKTSVRGYISILAGLLLVVIAAQVSQASDVSFSVDGITKNTDTSSPNNHSAIESAKTAKQRKIEGSSSASIFYELKYSKNREVCRSLLLTVNEDLIDSPYVDYSNTKHFEPWQSLNESINAPVPYKNWLLKYRPPLAKTMADLNHDGKVEHLYLITYHVPIARQWLVILSDTPRSPLKIMEDSMDQFSAFSDFVNAEKKTGNVSGEVQFFLPLVLSELPEHSNTNPKYFDAETASYFVYKFGKDHYLAAENIEYHSELSKRNIRSRWYLLFSVSEKAQLSTVCILKRIN